MTLCVEKRVQAFQQRLQATDGELAANGLSFTVSFVPLYEAFQAAYEEARRATFHAGMRRVQALTGKAIDTLDDLLDATDSPNVRLGAARTVAELGIHQHEAETILRKLDEIEEQQRRQNEERRC